MHWDIRSCLAFTAVLAAPLGAAGPSSKITVLIYNHAAIPSETLARTEAEAARIYQQCGIKIQWLDCPLSHAEAGRFPGCKIPLGPTWLTVRILSQPKADCPRLAQESFGFALYPSEGGFPMHAYVFAHDAEQLANTRGIGPGVVLGHVVTHEIGHLLLGPGSHSTNGIMQCSWHLKQLADIARGLMTFTPGEAERMRANIRARMAGQAAGLIALVPQGKQDCCSHNAFSGTLEGSRPPRLW